MAHHNPKSHFSPQFTWKNTHETLFDVRLFMRLIICRKKKLAAFSLLSQMFTVKWEERAF